ncbi:hypothetical protein ACE3MQ_14335 [Paenibacillus lentus]
MAHIVVGILEKFSGQGIGHKLFVEHWRKTTCITRLELTVMANYDGRPAYFFFMQVRSAIMNVPNMT